MDRRLWRDRLSGLRRAVKEARIGRRAAVRQVRDLCRAGRLGLRERQAIDRVAYREAQKAARAQFYQELRDARAAARDNCAAAKDAARSEAIGKLELRRRELEAEKAQRAEELRIRRIWKGGPEKKTRRRSIEAIAESDDAVIRNLPGELVPVWEKVKREIRGTPRMSRSEAFLQWVTDNPEEATRIVADKAEHDVEARAAELEAEEFAFKKYQAERKARGGKLPEAPVAEPEPEPEPEPAETVSETFSATAGDSRGVSQGDPVTGQSIRATIARADQAWPSKGLAVWIRGEYTSDGAHHGIGMGRLVASREPLTRGNVRPGHWLVESTSTPDRATRMEAEGERKMRHARNITRRLEASERAWLELEHARSRPAETATAQRAARMSTHEKWIARLGAKIPDLEKEAARSTADLIRSETALRQTTETSGPPSEISFWTRRLAVDRKAAGHAADELAKARAGLERARGRAADAARIPF